MFHMSPGIQGDIQQVKCQDLTFENIRMISPYLSQGRKLKFETLTFEINPSRPGFRTTSDILTCKMVKCRPEARATVCFTCRPGSRGDIQQVTCQDVTCCNIRSGWPQAQSPPGRRGHGVEPPLGARPLRARPLFPWKCYHLILFK